MDFQKEELKKIAKFQRLMIMAVGIQLLIAILTSVIPILGILTLPAGLFCVYAMVMVSQSLKHELGITIVYAICAFIPVVSLIALYLLAKKSSDALIGAGYKVGLLGMSKEDIEKIQ